MKDAPRPLDSQLMDFPAFDAPLVGDALTTSSWEKVMEETEPVRVTYQKNYNHHERKAEQNPEPFEL